MRFCQPTEWTSVVGPLSIFASSARSIFDEAGGTTRSPLAGKRILVVEDEFLLADEIANWLSLRGAEPVGPAAMLAHAQKLIEQDFDLHGAVLDINLAGTLVFPVALELERRRVPLLFASAYAEEVELPEKLSETPRLRKPFSEIQLMMALERAVGSDLPS